MFIYIYIGCVTSIDVIPVPRIWHWKATAYSAKLGLPGPRVYLGEELHYTEWHVLHGDADICYIQPGKASVWEQEQSVILQEECWAGWWDDYLVLVK